TCITIISKRSRLVHSTPSAPTSAVQLENFWNLCRMKLKSPINEPPTFFRQPSRTERYTIFDVSSILRSLHCAVADFHWLSRPFHQQIVGPHIRVWLSFGVGKAYHFVGHVFTCHLSASFVI